MVCTYTRVTDNAIYYYVVILVKVHSRYPPDGGGVGGQKKNHLGTRLDDV